MHLPCVLHSAVHSPLSTFTSVHEFANICKNGVAPTSWRFVVAKPANVACASSNYFNTNPIAAVSAVRPAQPRISSARRVNDKGEFELQWPAVSGAVAYTALVKSYSNGAGETPYYTTLVGERSTVSKSQTYVLRRSSSTDSALILQTNSAVVETGRLQQGLPRFFAVNAVNSQGVWSYTPDVVDYPANW